VFQFVSNCFQFSKQNAAILYANETDLDGNPIGALTKSDYHSHKFKKSALNTQVIVIINNELIF